MDAVHRIKILIVDDHNMVREGLKVLLESFEDFEVVATGDGRMVLTLCTAHRPDVVLMDMLMPIMDGVEATHLIREHFPTIRIIALSSSGEETLVESALKAGATSYILKSGSISDIVDAIKASYCGESILSPEVVNTLLSKMNTPSSIPHNGHNLSKREREVLELMVNGFTNRKIAQHLFISVSTVKNHVGSIFAKLGGGNRTKIAALAVEHHLFTKN